MPVVLEASDGQQIHHKLLGADAQRLSGEPRVRQGLDQLPDSAFSATLLSLASSPHPLVLYNLPQGPKGYVEEEEEGFPKAWHTYPQPVGQRHHLGCDSFGILLSNGIQDDVGQEAVTFLCIKHLFPGHREAQESHFCEEEERVDMTKAVHREGLRDNHGAGRKVELSRDSHS